MKIRDDIRQAVEDCLRDLGLDGEGVRVILERPREAAHGDMSTPVAMSLAKKLRQNPFEIAQKIASALSVSSVILLFSVLFSELSLFIKNRINIILNKQPNQRNGYFFWLSFFVFRIRWKFFPSTI